MKDIAQNSLDHLGEPAKKILTLSDEERIKRINGERWIGYTRAVSIMRKLDELFEYPKTHRMPNLLIVGRTNNGKTMIVERFADKHPADDNLVGEEIYVPVLNIQAPPVPDENRFYNTILDRFFAPYKPSEHVSKKQVQVISLLKRVGLRMLIIDEIQHILAGHMDKQRQFLNVIKYIGNELKIPIVGVGTKDAIRALQNDPQLANRFEPAPLPKWKMDEEYLKLLMSFERMLPLKKPSNLIETSMATKLLSLSEGTIGELSMLLRKAGKKAIISGKEYIDFNILDSVDWTTPSQRKQSIESMI